MIKLEPHEQKFIDELYNRYYDELFRYAVRFLDESGAEEAVQNVFMDACGKVDEVMASGNQVGWLVKALRFSIGKLKRSRQRQAEHLIYLPPKPDENFGVNRGLEDFPDTRPVNENLDLLYADLAAQKEFQLVKSFAVEGKSIKNLAQEEKITVGACKTRLHRARESLRSLWKKQNE